MSYILDALRRSEQERHQENIKNLTGQDSLIHVNKHKPQAWPYILILVLLVNAGIFLWMHFDAQEKAHSVSVNDEGVSEDKEAIIALKDRGDVTAKTSDSSLERNAIQEKNTDMPLSLDQDISIDQTRDSSKPIDSVGVTEEPIKSSKQASAETDSAREEVYIDGGLLIQPKGKRRLVAASLPNSTLSGALPVSTSENNMYAHVPYLVDTDISFQKQIPNLTFNSHIYSDMPSARRVMINNIYLREGQAFSGLEVLQIGERDIVFSKNGTLFKRPVMRDW